jgi:hypothetical protein
MLKEGLEHAAVTGCGSHRLDLSYRKRDETEGLNNLAQAAVGMQYVFRRVTVPTARNGKAREVLEPHRNEASVFVEVVRLVPSIELFLEVIESWIDRTI